MVSVDFLRNHIDFTLISPHVSEDEIIAFCERALTERVKTVYVPPCFLEQASKVLKGSRIEMGTTVGFPYGNQWRYYLSWIKTMIKDAARLGARWMDVCLDVSAIRSGDFNLNELVLLSTAREAGVGLKFIVESPYLSEESLIHVTQRLEKEGVDYLKTATGLGNKVSEREVEIIKHHLVNTKLKAAGGITTLEAVVRFFSLGADCVGSNRGFEILEEASRGEKPIAEIGTRHPVIWLTGQTGSGKSTLAQALYERLGAMVLDGDEVRQTFGSDLGLLRRDRIENNRRFAEFAKIQSVRQPVIVAVIAPFEQVRREVIDPIASPIWIYVERNLLVTKDKPYEAPTTYDLKVNSDEQSTEQQVELVIEMLKKRDLIS